MFIEVPEVHRGTHRDAAALAKARGDVLADIVHAAILSATTAAEAGHGNLLPAKPKPERKRREPGSPDPDTGALRYKAADGERERCWTAIFGAGSSPAAIAVEAMEAYVQAGGVRMDVVLPWVPRLRPRARGDRDTSAGQLQQAGAA